MLLSHEDLNDKQIEAIESPHDILLLACPGSGKTRTLTYKIAVELSKLKSPRKRVIAITYTNNAASEIVERIELLGVNTKQLWIGTIHAFCLEWILKPYWIYHNRLPNGFQVVSGFGSEKLIEELCATQQGIRIFDCGYYFESKGRVLQCSLAKETRVHRILDEYDNRLEQAGLIDFEQMLLFAFQIIDTQPKVSKLLSNIFSCILVDEYQDTKEIQYQIICRVLRAGNGSVGAFFVGDPNQSIFTTLGGFAMDIHALNQLSNLSFDERKLTKNYRNSDRIISFFDNFKVTQSEIISAAENKHYPSLVTFDRSTPKEHLVDEIVRLIRLNCEQCGIPQNEICIVGPWWIHLASLTRSLVSKLPDYDFDGPGLTPFQRDIENFWYKVARLILTKPAPNTYIRRLRWASDVLADLEGVGAGVQVDSRGFLRLVNGLGNAVEQDGLKYLNRCFDDLLEELAINCSLHESLLEHRISFFESAKVRITRMLNDGIEFAGDRDTFFRAFAHKNGVFVSSIHGVKGLEFDTVIAFAMLEGAVPNFNDTDNLASANKLLYVISSRARKNLHLVSESGRRNQPHPTSRLLDIDFSYTSKI
tara:strand:+ start:4457 stop:6229 length:1773 start_codon:yes stop_codon:yes gene_type:complete